MRDTNTGAAPEQQLAELNSDVHHLEQDFREHRATTARRHEEERRFREAMTLAHATQRADLAAVGITVARLEKTSQEHTAVLLQVRGATRVGLAAVGLIAGAAPFLIEIVKHLVNR